MGVSGGEDGARNGCFRRRLPLGRRTENRTEIGIVVNGDFWCGTPTVEAVNIDMEGNGGGGGAGNPHYRRRRRRRCRRRLSLAASTETTTYGSFRFFDRTRISLGPRLLPDEYSFAAVISVTCMLPAADYGKPLHAKSEKAGLQSSVYVGSTPGGRGIASP
nr:pentatricopeptide repeat-containing protein At3g50420 [Ipomoea trifida]